MLQKRLLNMWRGFILLSEFAAAAASIVAVFGSPTPSGPTCIAMVIGLAVLFLHATQGYTTHKDLALGLWVAAGALLASFFPGLLIPFIVNLFNDQPTYSQTMDGMLLGGSIATALVTLVAHTLDRAF